MVYNIECSSDQDTGAGGSEFPAGTEAETGWVGRGRPTVKPAGVCIAHIDTTLAHWRTEIVMPEGAVESDAGGVKEGYPGDADQLVGIQVRGQPAIPHMFGRIFAVNGEFSGRGLHVTLP